MAHHVFKDLHSASLLSVGQLCDSDYRRFHKTDLKIFDTNKHIIIRGTKLSRRIMGCEVAETFPIKEQYANAILHIDKRDKRPCPIIFMRARTAPKSTFLAAIRSGISYWPGLNQQASTTFDPKIATSKGHMRKSKEYQTQNTA
jgi:hypothetical protein